jgi:hypothetical protein
MNNRQNEENGKKLAKGTGAKRERGKTEETENVKKKKKEKITNNEQTKK